MKKITTLFIVIWTIFGYSQTNLKDKDIHYLVGKSFDRLENKIIFQNYSIEQISAFSLQRNNFNSDFAIYYYVSEYKQYLLFVKIEKQDNRYFRNRQK